MNNFNPNNEMNWTKLNAALQYSTSQIIKENTDSINDIKLKISELGINLDNMSKNFDDFKEENKESFNILSDKLDSIMNKLDTDYLKEKDHEKDLTNINKNLDRIDKKSNWSIGLLVTLILIPLAIYIIQTFMTNE